MAVMEKMIDKLVELQSQLATAQARIKKLEAVMEAADAMYCRVYQAPKLQTAYRKAKANLDTTKSKEKENE